MNYKDNVQNKRFNAVLLTYFKDKKIENSLRAFTDCLLDINNIYANTHGIYPETDDIWIDALCYEFAKMLSEWSGYVLDLRDESQKYMFDYLAMAELKAGFEDRTLDNLYLDWNN